MDGLDNARDIDKSTGIAVAVIWGMSIAALGCAGLIVAMAVAIAVGNTEGAYTVGITLGAVLLLIGACWAMASKIIQCVQRVELLVDLGNVRVAWVIRHVAMHRSSEDQLKTEGQMDDELDPRDIYARAFVDIVRQQHGAAEVRSPRLRSVRLPWKNDE